MEIEVKYESSQGPHPAKVDPDKVKQLIETGTTQVSTPVGNQGNSKFITITITETDRQIMREALG